MTLPSPLKLSLQTCGLLSSRIPQLNPTVPGCPANGMFVLTPVTGPSSEATGLITFLAKRSFAVTMATPITFSVPYVSLRAIRCIYPFLPRPLGKVEIPSPAIFDIPVHIPSAS